MYLNKKAYSSRQKQDSNHVEDKFKYPKKETPVWFSFTLKHNQRKKIVKAKNNQDNQSLTKFLSILTYFAKVLQILSKQGSTLTLPNSQIASDFDKLWVKKITTSKRLQVRIIHVSQSLFWKEFASGLTSLLVEKNLLAKLCRWTEKLTSSPV